MEESNSWIPAVGEREVRPPLWSFKERVQYLCRVCFLFFPYVSQSEVTLEGVGKDERPPLPHPACAGRLHAHLAVPAEEPAAPAQEEARGLPQRAHLAQGR